MMCFKFRRREKEKSNFIRRMTTFGRGAPSHGRNVMRQAMVTALGCNVGTMIGLDISASFHDCVKKHVRQVYDTAKGSNTYLSRQDYEAFLRGTQKVDDIKLPHADKPDNCHADDDDGDDGYRFHQFFYLWCTNESAWRAAGEKQQDGIDASHPISSYFINSSHNTYLDGNQLSSDSSAEAYRRVLRGGGRCIEIDVWNGPVPRTPSKSPNPGHRRHFSSGSGSLPRFGEKLDALMSVRASRQHSRSPSAVQTAFPAPNPRESGTTLDPSELNERLEKSRDSSSMSQRVEPVVHHGKTITSSVGFREVCRAVRESAFERNPLPIIVSLEVGAEREQQEVMVDIMKEEWAGLLLDKPFDSCDHYQRQPQLSELFNKILIKVKRVDPNRAEGEPERGRSVGLSTILPKPPVCEALAALAIYTHSEHYEDENSLSSRTPSHIFSLSEDTFLSLTATDCKIRKMLAHNRDFFMRIYPNGMRFDSSNPDPSFHWRRGVQMVAMNWQSTDEGMMINDAMFAGTNGWVLKPPSLRKDNTTAEMSTMSSDRQRTIDLRITVLAGQFLPLPGGRNGGYGVGVTSDKKFRPKVKVELHVEKPQKSLDYARETASARTENPDWGMDPPSLDFLNVKNVVEELSFVRFKISDTSGKFGADVVAWACIRLDLLRPGYRCVDLLRPDTRDACREKGKLFVKIDKVWRD